LGPIYGLVNNAAITGGFARVDETNSAMLERLVAVNVIGPMLCLREAVKRMSTRYGHSGGSIVNISSLAERTGGAGEWVHYAATKGAIDTLTIGSAREVADEGIRINAVSPGLIETDLHTAAGAPDRPAQLSPGIPMKRPGTPDEIAAGVSLVTFTRSLLRHRLRLVRSPRSTRSSRSSRRRRRISAGYGCRLAAKVNSNSIASDRLKGGDRVWITPDHPGRCLSPCTPRTPNEPEAS
jgi:NAD(P)-dependent dehydrogenase (short-subunit alcohol dehydrogenase family)